MKRFLLILLFVPLVVVAQQPTVRIDHTISIFNDVMRQLDMNYVDTLNYEELTNTAINQMLRKVDPYTVYYPKQEDDNLKMMTTGKYGGIGALIQMRELTDKKGNKETRAYISLPYEGKPAQRNDVRAGDCILSVDGWNAKNHPLQEVSNHLRGVPGSTVKLVLEREGVSKPINKEFAREEVHLDPVNFYTLFPDSVGYISFSEFTSGSAQAFMMAVSELVDKRGAKALIIDLRENGGGIVDEALQILSLFLPKGTEVVSTKGKLPQSCRSYTTSSYPIYPNLPLMVMVNSHSASASEIVAGSLQDLGRARLIGERTFGKGLVQNLRPVAYDGHLKVTTAKYYLPSGRCIQAIDYAERQKGNELKRDTAGGILPDIVMTDSQKVDICYSLFLKHMDFDFATRYRQTHDSIASPETFAISSDEIEDFCTFLEERKFLYETETGKYLHELIKMAENEDIDSTAMVSLRALETQLQPSFRDAIYRHLDEVKQMLGAAIVERYGYQKARIAFLLRDDKEVLRARKELITNPLIPNIQL